MKGKRCTGIVLGASKIAQELIPIFGDKPSMIILINGKPVVFFILDYFKSMGIKKAYVSVGYEKEKVVKLLNSYSYAKDFDVCPVSVDPSKRPGTALLSIIKSIPSEEKRTNTFYVHLADTMPYDSTIFPFDRNFVVVSHDYDQSEKWCAVDLYSGSKSISTIYDKREDKEGRLAIAGGYHFTDLKNFDDMPERNFAISHLLKHLLNNKITIEAVEIQDWRNLGHLKNYYRTKAHFLSSRSFNKLHLKELMNTILKLSDHNEILKDEILWYLNIPKELKIYAPRIIDCNIDDEKQIYAEFEFYGYPSLTELWLYGGISQSIWQVIIDRIFAIINKFLDHKHEVSFDDYIAMYAQKTKERVSHACESNAQLCSLFGAESVVINNQKLKGWPFFKNHLTEFAKMLYKSKDNCLLHGDMCFSNILFDLNYGVMKLIDPRGRWGSHSIYGDIKYDVAKLRHSICGYYDHILSDHIYISLSYSEQNQNEWIINLDFMLLNELQKSVGKYFDRRVSELWDLNQIKLIEGLLFISMISLHTENVKRQIAMFAQGIALLNESFEKV